MAIVNPNVPNDAAFGLNLNDPAFQTSAGRFGSGNTELTLANGMTAGAGTDASQQRVKPPDSRIYGGNPALAPVRVGIMRNIPGVLPPIGNGPPDGSYALYFMFNPNDIAASFSMTMSSTPPVYMYGSGVGGSATDSASAGTAANAVNILQTNNAQATAIPNLANSQTVTWSLMFDRTYDIMFDSNPGENRGCLVDVGALYNLMGTFESNGAVPISTPVEVVFGQTAAGQLWGFTGYINQLSIEYGEFRYNMIPAKCLVTLGMQCTYIAPQTPPSAGDSAQTTADAASSTIATILGVAGLAVTGSVGPAPTSGIDVPTSPAVGTINLINPVTSPVFTGKGPPVTGPQAPGSPTHSGSPDPVYRFGPPPY